LIGTLWKLILRAGNGNRLRPAKTQRSRSTTAKFYERDGSIRKILCITAVLSN
jgi:hypothetical protein